MARARPGTLIYRPNEQGQVDLMLDRESMTIGRSVSCDIVIPLSIVSRLHARIELEHDRYVLSDAGSANGTFVSGVRIERGHQLGTGDEIWLGSAEAKLTFSDPDETLGVVLSGGAPALA